MRVDLPSGVFETIDATDDNNNVPASAARPAISYQLPNIKTRNPKGGVN